ncbi:MAG: amidohydrolase family protein, partial [Firmicutes bacterium]|nr:amidohydrolase family protein [Bacillota bacterium]
VNEKYKGKLLSFGGIHPLDEDYKAHLKTVKNAGLKGIKLHPDYQDAFIDDIHCKRIIYEASALGLIVLVHAGRDIGYGDPVHCPPEKTLEVINEIKPEKLVLAHLGGWEQWDEVYERLCSQNVWFDTAFCLEYIKTESFYGILKKHGYRRILFATDSPWSPQKDYIERMRALLPEKTVFDAVMGENAKELLYGQGN